MVWRWDQGRGDYFQFDNLRMIAKALLSLEGVGLSVTPDPLRTVLETSTGLPFAPDHYTVWRNYGRVFEASLLAARVTDQLICTDVCRAVAGHGVEPWSVDEYLIHVMQSFYFQSPVFTGYAPTGPQVFPLCAILKLLLANALTGTSSVSLKDVLSKLAGGTLTGAEPLAAYAGLRGTGYAGTGDEVRQVREMMRFLSQFSFLKWEKSELVLDVSNLQQDVVNQLVALATPRIAPREAEPSSEVMQLGRVHGLAIQVPALLPVSEIDEEFTEGRKVRVTHLRTERSKRLKKEFFKQLGQPWECDICDLHPPSKYPWVDNLLEPHHLLPLSSAARVGKTMTLVRDLVPVCPNCHSAVHIYYKGWLRANGRDDFVNKAEAEEVYEEAKATAA